MRVRIKDVLLEEKSERRGAMEGETLSNSAVKARIIRINTIIIISNH